MIEIDKTKKIISDFFQEHKLKILVIAIILIVLLLFNYLLGMYNKNEPITSRSPFALIMQPETKISSKAFIESEALIINFAQKASEGDYESAYNMLSMDCQAEVFGTVEEFSKYAKINFPKGSRYEIIPYSKIGTTYIYQVKVFENFLATGLTYSDYSYIDLKMAINEDIKGEKSLLVAGYMGKFPIDSVFENDYIRIEVNQKTSFYTTESYSVIITNRTENDIIIQDYTIETPEIQLSIGGDVRPELNYTDKIVISGYQTLKFNLSFAKFFDESSIASSLVFSAIRVVNKGKAINYNSNDILAKFSVSTPITD